MRRGTSIEMEMLNIGRTETKTKKVEMFGDHYGYGGPAQG